MITVFGSVNIDLVGRVARLPTPGETLAGEGFAIVPGGKGANQALAARRAGAGVRMVGAVGRDAFAGAALAELRAAGVDLRGLREVEAPTGAAMILVDGWGENVIVIFAGANDQASAGDLAGLAWGPGDLLLLQMEVRPQETARAAALARAAGACVVLSLAPYMPPAPDLLAAVDVLLLNAGEAAALAGHLGLRDQGAEALAGRLGIDVVVTLGAGGAVAAGPWAGRIEAPALKVEAVDTVGAGDTFAGYLAEGLHAGRGWGEALARAAAAASLACTRAGAQGAFPEAGEVAAALSR